MGIVIDLQAVQAARASAQSKPRDAATDWAWADQVAAFWYSPSARLIAAAGVFAVVMTGLGLAVFAIAGLMGALS